MKIKWKHVALGTGIVLFDLFIYFVLALLLMNYDDFYTESKGEYWSLASMTTSEKITYISFVAWPVLNVLGVLYIIFRILKKLEMNWWKQQE